MGETRRKKERRHPIRPTEKLPLLPVAKDRALSDKQKSFCRQVIDDLLNDETSLSFSMPVNELWDMSVLSEYYEKITKPMDLGTVRKRVTSAHYVQPASDFFDPNAYRAEARLVFLNAISYNGKSSDLGKLAIKFLTSIDSKLADLPVPQAKPEDASKSPRHDHQQESKTQGKQDATDDKTDKDDNQKKAGEVTTGRASNKRDGDQSLNHRADGEPAKDSDDVDMEDKEAKSDDKVDEEEDEEENPPEPRDEMEDDGKEPSNEDAERERLEREIAQMSKARARSHAAIAEIELEKNVPLTFDENAKLRDEVEALPWDLCQKVVGILRKHVDDALRDGEESDPEYVTLEFSQVEPQLLRQIEALIRPDARVEKEKKAIREVEHGIEAAKRKLKRMGDGAVADARAAVGKKKRSKKSR